MATTKRARTAKADGKMNGKVNGKINGIGDEAVRAQTGRTWAERLAALDAAGARQMTHGEIASLLRERFGVPGWWTQMVTACS